MQTGYDEDCQRKGFSKFSSKRKNAVLSIRFLDFNAGTLTQSEAGNFLQSVKHYHLEVENRAKLLNDSKIVDHVN